MLNASIQDEYRSHATYAGVLVNFPDQKPFSNIVEAEAQHISAVSQLFDIRGLSVPGSLYATGDIAGFSTVTAACAASVSARPRPIRCTTSSWSCWERHRQTS